MDNNQITNIANKPAPAIQGPGFVGANTTRLKSFVVQCKRVWQVLRKPSNEEFKMVAKVSAIGILAVGALGFIISDIIKLFFK